MEHFDRLEQEMKASDNESDKWVALAVLAILVACLAVTGLLFLLVEEPQSWLLAAVMPVILLSQAVFMSRSHRRRREIFARHGFLCQNCHKTPYSLALLKKTSRQFCPFCQLKYAP